MRIEWPPKAEKRLVVRGTQVNREGEPFWINLRRHGYDKALRGHHTNACCDCGLVHLIVYEVFRDAAGNFHMVKRTYRLEDGRRRKR